MAYLFSTWYDWSQKFEDKIVDGHDKVARSIAKRPFVWIACVSVLAAICCIGLVEINRVTDTEKMWAPSDTVAQRNLEEIENSFGPLTRFGSVLFTSKDSLRKNILNLADFETLWDVHEKVLNTVQGDGKYFSDICATRDSLNRCTVYGVLQFFNNNRTYYNQVVKNQNQLIASISSPVFPDGTAVLRKQIFGRYTEAILTNPLYPALLSAEATTQFYFLKKNPLETTKAWEADLDETIEDSDSTDRVGVYSFATSTVDNSLAATDPATMYIMYAVVVAVMLLTLHKSYRFTELRIGLTICGLLVIAFANAAGHGICAGLGLATVTINVIVPFVIVVAGVNDLYIITSAFDAQDSQGDIEDRMAEAMRRCGKSIGFTAITTAVAFFLGSMSRFFAIRQFCYYAAVSILCNYVLMITVFCAMVCIDAQRRDDQRWDLLCCIVSPQAQQSVLPINDTDDNAENALPSAPNTVSDDAAGASPVVTKPVASTKRHTPTTELTYMEYFFSELYFPLLKLKLFRLLVVVGFAGLFIANVFGIYQIEQGFDVANVIKPSDPARDAIITARDLQLYAPEQSTPVTIVFGQLPYHTQAVQEEILRLQAAYLANTDYNAAPMISWVTAFTTYVRANPLLAPQLNADKYLVNEAIFYTALQTFTNNNQFKRFKADIVFAPATDPNSVTPIIITTSRVNSFHNNMRGPINQVNTMRHGRELMAESTLSIKPFLFAPPYTRAEGYAISVKQVISYYVAVLVGVGGVALLVLKPNSLMLVVWAVILVAMTQVNVMGNMARWGYEMQINFVTVIFITMSTGLIVDYVLHTLAHYTQLDMSRSSLDRLQETIVAIGPSILKGGITMLIAIIPLAFGGEYIYSMFFRFAFCIICYSLGHGLLLLPAVLPTLSYLLCEPCIVGESVEDQLEVDGKGEVELLKQGGAVAGQEDEDAAARASRKENEVTAFQE
eukprot:CAMPEP_0184970488 /NCGR_PEP_ID=MMETSP1098-20130426/2953_1 /TAXON_ID=89044 /ORGANISM="Spumella elongata, Strain CCAP 955/1" /LENGTH=952 /DNA_ID=CAMNT_0027492431 /DNA_START=56 /DNA_END=2914 /DNA_ORIENTATION=+